MDYKFERLEVWRLSLILNDHIYSLIEILPEHERFNLSSQIRRACTSVSLNIAEGSTSASNAEQTRFLTYSIRSLIEVIACLRLVERREYFSDLEIKNEMEQIIDRLFIKLQAFKKALN